MAYTHGKTPLMKRLLAAGAALLALGSPLAGADLKLVDTPLNQVIELYSRETGRSVFVDEGVQVQRRVNAHLRGMTIEAAFEVMQKSLGLETRQIGTGTVLLFPTERAARYAGAAPPVYLRVPAGLDSKWVTSALNLLLPSLKVLTGPGDDRSLALFGQSDQVREAREFARRLPEATGKTLVAMTEGEAKLAARDLAGADCRFESGPAGLALFGSPETTKGFLVDLVEWRKAIAWGSDVFTPDRLEGAKALKAGEALKGRAEINDLGGTGSLLVEGPAADRERILDILRRLDTQETRSRREIPLGEMKPEMARDAVKHLGVDVSGDRRLMVMGRESAVEEAAAVLTALSKKKRQVLISFRLAEIAKSRLRNLGIDLDKAAYSYGEIKEFHPQDTLPLLLRVLDEGKDARILANPNLRVIEGEEAKVTIGDRIPLEVSATAQTDSGSVLKLNTQLQWVDVGIKMTVKNVAVNADHSIRMAISGEVSSVVATTKQGYPQIRTREAESSLRVNDGGSVVMGGLLSREERDGQNKIPLLGNIPLFGGLARSRDRQKAETEIIMIVTARLAGE
jgi:type II secretory pathway component GspD/PulD (secretin)